MTTCDCILADPSVSRQHAKLCIVETGLKIVDLGSRNGTFVSGRRVQDEVALDGDIVRFGDFEFATVKLTVPSGEEVTNEPRESDEVGNGLSTAQLRVFDHLIEGLPEKTIAKRLGLASIRFTITHVRSFCGMALLQIPTTGIDREIEDFACCDA